nr:GMC oxidoreductase [Pseudohalocynthiibacter aestuariivivens]
MFRQHLFQLGVLGLERFQPSAPATPLNLGENGQIASVDFGRADGSTGTATGKVVDADLRGFDHRNLFLLGSGTFPASATTNPSLTIAALSLRAVDAIAASVTQD